MSQYQFGVVGLAVMGRGLALNLAEHGFSVAGYNLEPELTAAFTAEGQRLGFSVTGCPSYEALCSVLEKPRKILIMVKAGKPVDYVLDGLLPHLEARDIVIDGGNSHYPETQARQLRCRQSGVHFLGMGVSGGEEGARHGPALMPGGDPEAYRLAAPFLTAIAAHVGQDPCCAYIGPEGAGHYVKMVHNGIEYGDMQLICEAYYLMKQLLHLSPDQIADHFRRWNLGELSSYLMEISAHILTVPDPETGAPLVDRILGEAGSKGTGMWTVQEALSLGVPLPTIAQAVFARDLSCRGQVRAAMSRQAAAHPLPTLDQEAFAEKIRRALYASKLCSYAQGFELLHQASQHYHWDLDLGASPCSSVEAASSAPPSWTGWRRPTGAWSRPGKPAAFQRFRAGPGPVSVGLAGCGSHRRPVRRGRPRLLRQPELLRRAVRPRRPAEPPSGPAGLLRRPHLPPD